MHLNLSSILSLMRIISIVAILSSSAVGVFNLVMTIVQKEKRISISFFAVAWVFVVLYLCVSSNSIQTLVSNAENSTSSTITSASSAEDHTQKQTFFNLFQQQKEDNVISKGR